MESILSDVRHAIRTLSKAPAFALAAILTLALGIGVNIAVFTVFHAALLESLPVREPERLKTVYTWTQAGSDRFDFSYPLYVDLRDGNDVFSGLAATTSRAVGASARNRNERVIAEYATTNYFQTLGVELAAGPGFTSGDEVSGSRSWGG